MSRTDGHNISCRRSNCSGCGKGLWRRLENRVRRRVGKREIRDQLEGF